jgi:signal transduction histidine kinase
MMLFGGIAGVNWFDPGKIQANPYVARPVITGVYVDDTLMVRDTTMNLKRLELPFNKNTISITYRALEFTLPEGNQYAYMLEGQDRDWVYTSNDKVRFANLTPGTYTFKLKVSNNEGLWNDEPLELELVIVPPYWQTWWFRALIFLALAGVVTGAVRIDINRRVRRKTLELEKQHALNMERLRISKDVHDDIGSGLSRISLLSEMAARKIRDNQMPEKDLGSISAITKELVDNMRDLIWVLNPENTTLENLITRIREYCADYLDGLPVDTQFSFPDTVPPLNISREVQRNIFSTVKEAVNNCVKHSGATRILIAARVDREHFILIISDNGRGFEECEARKEGNGLRNMKHRIDVTGGIFEIVSGKGSGTQITISVPFVLLGTDPDPEVL